MSAIEFAESDEMQTQAYRQPWMTDDQWQGALFLRDLFGGFHHVRGNIKDCGRGVQLNTRSTHFATFDFDGLTRAVFMAHDRCMRLEIATSGPGMICLKLHKRHTREGRLMERHPTLEEAVDSWRAKP